MLTESQIDSSLIRKVVREQFGIRVINFRLVSKWEAARACIIESPNHEKFFLKIYSDDRIPNSAFRFAYDLFTKVGITNITHPIATSDGRIRTQIGDYFIALFNLVSGKTAEEQKLTDGQLERLGELLANVHQSKTIIGEYSVRENFEIPFKNKLISLFSTIPEIASTSSKYKNKLRVFLEPHTDHFKQELETLEGLQRKITRKHLEFVNCHGEPSPGNILSSDPGEIHLLDWDEPIFAPKEKDLVFFKGNIGPVMKGYTLSSKDNDIDQDLIEFYGHLWNLGEIADYGSKILFENHSDAQNRIWLDNMKGGWDFTF